MNPLRSPVLPLLLALAAPGLSQRPGVGDPLPNGLSLDGFSSAAVDFEEYSGRAVLFEFFAYW